MKDAIRKSAVAMIMCAALPAAAVDVVKGEPQSADSPLIGAKNLYITPHLAWSDREAREQIINTSAENLKSFLKGEDKNRIV